jgi:WD40 repeat protein
LNALPLSQFDEIVFALDLPRGILAPGSDAQGNRAKALLDWAEGPTGCSINGVLNLLAEYASLETIRNPQVTALSSEATIAATSSTPPHSISLDRDIAPKIDWGEKPDTGIFFGRAGELATLNQWVMTEQCRLVTLLGMGGIGKTSLAAKLADQIYEQFDYVIWRSLREAPPLDEILVRLIQFLSDQQETEINLPSRLGERIIRLLHYLREQRCLLVLDNLESILQAESTGQFRDGYEGYGELIRRIGEAEHQSCLLLTSRECPRELAPMAGDCLPVRLWSVSGIDTDAGREILKAKGLELDEADTQGQELIRRYSGNPQALHLVATAIQKEFLGDVNDFLEEEGAAVEDVRSLLDQHLTRLAPLERSILFWLAINREPVGLDELMEDLLPPVTKREVRSALRGLSDRYLIETVGKQFTLQNVIMEFATDRFVEQVRQELNIQQFDLFHTHALIKATAKNYVRETQIRLILKPTVLCIANLDEQVTESLQTIRRNSAWSQGYAAGNLINLLCHLQKTVYDFDFSRLVLRQVHMKGMELQKLNFTDSQFDKVSLSFKFNRIKAVSVSPNKDFFATGDSNGDIQLWQVSKRQYLKTLTDHNHSIESLEYSPDGHLLVSGSGDGTFRLWDVKNYQCLHVFRPPDNISLIATFSPNGRFLASAGDDAIIRLWDVQKFNCLQVLKGHNGKIQSLAFSPSGKYLVSGSHSSNIKLWNIEECTCIHDFSDHRGSILSLAFSPDSCFFASGGEDKIIRIWDVRRHVCVCVLNNHISDIETLVFSPDGKTLVSGSNDNTIQLWDLQEHRRLHIFSEHNDKVNSLALSFDGQLMISSSEDRTVRLWDLQKRQCLDVFPSYSDAIMSLAISPNGHLLTSSSNDGMVQLWDFQKRQCLDVFLGHTTWVTNVAFSPDSQLIASSSGDKTVRIWSVQKRQCINIFFDHADWVGAVAFSHDGTLLASGSEDSTVRLWDLQKYICLCVLEGHTNWIGAVSFSPNGRLLASCGEDKTIRLWDLQNYQCVDVLRDHTEDVRWVAFSPDGQLLASCSRDNTTRLWNLKNRQCVQVLGGHTNWIRRVAFSPNGRLLASCSEDKTIRLWDLQNYQCLNILRGHTNWVTAVEFTPDGNLLASCSYDETVRLWDVHSGKCSAVFRNPRPYEGSNITGVLGLTEAQKVSMLALGAVDLSSRSHQENYD